MLTLDLRNSDGALQSGMSARTRYLTPNLGRGAPLAVACALALGACNQTSSPGGPATQPAEGRGLSPKDRDGVDPDGVVRRGAALTDAPAVPVAEVFERADQLANQRLKVVGTADSVCNAEGCWFTLQAQDGRFIRVMAKDHAFFVPSKVRGMIATVEGDLGVKVLSKKETPPLGGRELTISALGLEMTTPPGG